MKEYKEEQGDGSSEGGGSQRGFISRNVAQKRGEKVKEKDGRWNARVGLRRAAREAS